MSDSSLATKSVYTLSLEEKRETQQVLETQLMRSLAAYVALRSSDPICTVLDDLFSLEMKAAQFLGEAIPAMAAIKLHGSLAGVMTVIPMSTKGLTAREREVVDPSEIPGSSDIPLLNEAHSRINESEI